VEPFPIGCVARAMPTVKTRLRVAANQIGATLLERHGRTYSEDLGIRLEANTPSALFCWLCAALLFSARINKPSTAVNLLFIATRL
jgi:hypothetical protein